MSFKLLHNDVIEPGLCARCGVCADVCPTKAIGFDCRSYPRLVGKCTNCGYCNHSCPGAEVDFNALSKELFGRNYDPHSLLGTQEQMFVGYPTDETIRREGASGGLTTGLLVYLLKTDRIKGAIVIGHDPDKPWQFKSALATSRAQIVSAAKSKYCIVPSMSVLAELHKKEGPFAVVGLPCQVHGLRKIAAVYPKLANKIKPKLSDFWGSSVPRSCSSRVCSHHRHTHGYVEDGCEPLMGNRSVQSESKIAQFGLNIYSAFTVTITWKKMPI